MVCTDPLRSVGIDKYQVLPPQSLPIRPTIRLGVSIGQSNLIESPNGLHDCQLLDAENPPAFR